MVNKKYKLKLKNFWRKNEKLILMIIGAFILGLVTASLNYVHYQNVQNKFTLEEPQNISNRENAEFKFNLNQPSLASGTSMRLEFKNVDSNTPITIKLNGQKQGQVSSNVGLVEISTDSLQSENTVLVERSDRGFQENQKLVEAKVTSTTNFEELMFVILNFGSLLLMGAPIMYVKYNEFQRRKAMENKFPEFLRDIVEGTRAGMSLPQAIQSAETGSYGPLDEKIDKLSAQLDWGIPFEDALKNFSNDTGSQLIQRSVDTIIQAYSSGGDIQDVLDSVGDNIRTIKELKEERESQLYGEMVTGYIVFFIFIGILIALTNFLLPNLAEAQSQLGGGGQFSVLGNSGSSLQENINLYETWFKRLVYIQALFSGLIIGKLAEGELKAGFKHMAVLFAVGYLAITFFL